MTSLAQLLGPDRVVHLPTVWDGISARVAAETGWDAVLTSGLGVAATMGLPDMDLYSVEDNLRTVRIVAGAGEFAVMADLDSGYGDQESVARIVPAFERAGATSLMMEDQATPKRCPFYPGEPPVLASVKEATAKVRAAVLARTDSRTLVIARTDARETDDIFRRAAAYAEAGAHLIMPNAPGDEFTVADWRRLHDELGLPLVGSALPGSRLEKELTDDVCVEVGVQVRIDALHALYATTSVLRDVLGAMRRDGVEAAAAVPMLSHHEFGALMREDDYRASQAASSSQ